METELSFQSNETCSCPASNAGHTEVFKPSTQVRPRSVYDASPGGPTRLSLIGQRRSSTDSMLYSQLAPTLSEHALWLEIFRTSPRTPLKTPKELRVPS
jgi:hypothetical protein